MYCTRRRGARSLKVKEAYNCCVLPFSTVLDRKGYCDGCLVLFVPLPQKVSILQLTTHGCPARVDPWPRS